MKSFILLKTFYQFGGVLKFESKHRARLIQTLINCFFYGLCSILFLSTLAFFSFGNRTFSEYSECLYFLMGSLLMTSWYSVYLWQSEKYVELFSTLDKIIEQSK